MIQKLEKQSLTLFFVVHLKSHLIKSAYLKKDDFDERAKASHQSATDLIANRNSLKSAIVKSNTTTDVDVNGKIMTRAEAIERKNSIEYEELLLAEMKRQYANATTTVDKEKNKESGKPDSRAGARLRQQPSSSARSAHPKRSVFVS